jgi:signal transduction histidine kinase
VLRRLLALFVPGLAILATILTVLYLQVRSKQRAILEAEADHTVDLQREIAARELRSVESDLLFLAEQRRLRDFLSGDGDKRELAEEYVLFARRRGLYDQVRCLGRDGMELVRVNFNGGEPRAVPENELQLKADRYYFTAALGLARGQVFVSPFDLNIEHGRVEEPFKPVIRFATPVFDAGGERRGVLVLDYLGSALLAKLDEVSRRAEGSFLLLNQDGDYLRGPSPDEEWGFLFGKDRTFQDEFPEEWQWIALESTGQFRTARGLFTFRTVVPGEPVRRVGLPPVALSRQALKIVAHVPAELFAAKSRLVLHMVLLGSGPGALLLVLLWYVAFVREMRRRDERRLSESEARLRALSTRLLDAQENERRRISRDLHDELGQMATALNLHLDRAVKAPDAKRTELLEVVRAETERLLEQIHALSQSVRPLLLDDLGLKDAVQDHLAQFEERTGIHPTAELAFQRHDLPPAVSENVFRILQEALNNVAKHAQVKEVTVVLRVWGDRLELTVRDLGAGFSPESVDGGRLGLLGMRERAELLGGEFHLRSQPGAGTEVRVTLPLARAFVR